MQIKRLYALIIKFWHESSNKKAFKFEEHHMLSKPILYVFWLILITNPSFAQHKYSRKPVGITGSYIGVGYFSETKTDSIIFEGKVVACAIAELDLKEFLTAEVIPSRTSEYLNRLDQELLSHPGKCITYISNYTSRADFMNCTIQSNSLNYSILLSGKGAYSLKFTAYCLIENQ